MSFNVNGTVALVTGANRGIGKSIVETLIDKGVTKIYAAVRNVDSAAPLVEAFGDKIVPIRFDLADPNSITAAAAAASDAQLVINNAGVLQGASPLSPSAIETPQCAIAHESSASIARWKQEMASAWLKP